MQNIQRRASNESNTSKMCISSHEGPPSTFLLGGSGENETLQTGTNSHSLQSKVKEEGCQMHAAKLKSEKESTLDSETSVHCSRENPLTHSSELN